LSKNTFAFGLAGCGDIAQNEYKAILTADDSKLSVVMDSRLEHARAFGETVGIPYTASYAELLESDIDAVVIAVPHFLHRELAISAARAGKHIILEKPIATTVEDGEAIIRACKEEGVRLSVAFVQRYRRGNLLARQLIEAGAIGTVFHIHGTDCFEKPQSYWSHGYSGAVSTDWRSNRARSGGGVWMMNGSHTIDLLLHTTGLQPESVYATAANRHTPQVDVEDDVSALVRFNGGAVASLSACSAAAGDPRSELFICGTNGTICLDSPPRLFLREEHADFPANCWITLAGSEEDGWQEGRNELFRRFVASARAGAPTPIPGEEALAALKVVLATYESAERGEPVCL
jgi:predicted dehydrogenase